MGKDFNTLILIEIIFILTELLVLGVFLWIGNYGNITLVESIHLLLRWKLFSIRALTIGLIIPLGLLIYYNLVDERFAIPILANLLLLASGLFLRYCIW
jgi:formate-dependent nitrite reductase membrane component NrfD